VYRKILKGRQNSKKKAEAKMFMSRDPESHRSRPKDRVLALHCSGADGRQWRKLRAVLPPDFELIAPDFYGCESTGSWQGARPFTLADEAAAIVSLIDRLNAPVHLVGHSYGGCVALRVAIERPQAVSSISLYEPSAFHLLKQFGERSAAEFAEIRALADDVGKGVLCGAYQAAAQRFVDYWNGPGAWKDLRSDIRMSLLRWLPKAPLDFEALIEEPTPASAYQALNCPMLVLHGEHASPPSRLIVNELLRLVPCGCAEVVSGAGHMGPMSHGEETATRIAGHLRRATLAFSDERIAGATCAA